MNIRPPVISVLVLAIGFILALPSTSAFAQDYQGGAGLTSGSTAGRNSQFDNGTLKSQSALGQLEEMTGSKVDRSSSQYSNRNTTSRAAPQSAPAKPRYDPNQAFRQELAGAVAGALIGALFSDNSAQQRAEAEAAAARAAAEAAAQAEAYRVQQELIRQARIQKAQHYRADWDSREGDITDRLGGAFNIGTGTAFFGRPANPDADVVAAILHQDVGGATPAPGEAPDVYTSDPSVVDLRSSRPGLSSISPSSLRPPQNVSVANEPILPEETASELGKLLGYFVPELKDIFKGVAQSTAKETAWGLAEDIPYQPYAKAIVEFEENRREYTDKLKELNEHLLMLALGRPEALVYAAAHGDPRFAENYWAQLPHEVGQLTVEYMKLAYNSLASHASIDLGKLRPPVDTGAY